MSDLVPPLYVLAAADRPLGLVRAFLTSYEVGLVLLCVVAACYCVRPAREDNVDSTAETSDVLQASAKPKNGLAS